MKSARCGACGEDVENAEDGCLALDQIYHTNCFVCSSCGRTLRGTSFYSIRGKVYCEEDYENSGFKQMSIKCSTCGHTILDTVLQALGNPYHPGCFRCCICDCCLGDEQFILGIDQRIYCCTDFHRVNASVCDGCGDQIMPATEESEETVRVVSMGKDFHIDCFHCKDCGMLLTDEREKQCYPLDDQLLCLGCHLQRLHLPPPPFSPKIIGEIKHSSTSPEPISSSKIQQQTNTSIAIQPLETRFSKTPQSAILSSFRADSIQRSQFSGDTGSDKRSKVYYPSESLRRSENHGSASFKRLQRTSSAANVVTSEPFRSMVESSIGAVPDLRTSSLPRCIDRGNRANKEAWFVGSLRRSGSNKSGAGSNDGKRTSKNNALQPSMSFSLNNPDSFQI